MGPVVINEQDAPPRLRNSKRLCYRLPARLQGLLMQQEKDQDLIELAVRNIQVRRIVEL
jgi:hypothetical protein